MTDAPPDDVPDVPRDAIPCSPGISYVRLYRPRTIASQPSPSSSEHEASNDDEAQPSKRRRRKTTVKRYHLLFAALYLYQFYWVFSTVGVPYREFLDKAEREGFEGESETDLFSGLGIAWLKGFRMGTDLSSHFRPLHLQKSNSE